MPIPAHTCTVQLPSLPFPIYPFQTKADSAPIPEDLLAGATDLEFGTQELRSLQLLERRSNGADGYYAKIAEVELGADGLSKIHRAMTRGGVVILDQREGQHEG